MNDKYSEIKELHEYCLKIGIDSTLETLFDGYKILFPNGGDIIQHMGSYGHDSGCVEPAGISPITDYTAMPLKHAKALVKRHKDKLNRRREG